MRNFFLPALIAAFCIALLLGGLNSHAYSDGDDSGSCDCHGSDKTSTTTITVNGFPNATYTPGLTYNVTVSVSDTGLASTEGGLYVIVDQGSLATTDSNLELVDSGDPQELQHSTKSAVSWTFSWTAPTDLVWVNIRIIAMVADGDTSIDGDLWNSMDLQINAAGSTDTSAPPPLPEKDEDEILFTDLVLVLSLTAVIATIGVHMVLRVFVRPIKHEKRIIYLDELDESKDVKKSQQ
ncbi:MAG: choice-of-anchor V domain-containing protein [Candidatus Hodarchaeota archaeon]